MAALEDRVLTKILTSRSLELALKRGLTEEHFLNPESKIIYRFLRQHWFDPKTCGELPTIERVRQRWPAFTLTATTIMEEGGLSTLIDDLKMKSFESDAWAMSDYYRELLDEDPVNAVRVMKKHFLEMEAKLNTSSNYEGMGLQSILTMAKEHYKGAQNGSIYGIPWPWECLTNDTLGKRAGDFTVFYGRMKSLKTWVLLYCAIVDYLFHNKRVLIWSREMSPEKLGLRVASLLSGVDYQLFKKGLLPPKIRDRCFLALESLVAGRPLHDIGKGGDFSTRDLRILSGRQAPHTLDGLKKEVDEFEPHVIYLDSFYHLDTEKSLKTNQRWQRVAVIAEDVKSYAETAGLPIVAVHQANRAGEKTYGNTLADLADADVIAREADLIIRILKPPGAPRELYEEEYEEEIARLLKAKAKPKLPVGVRRPKLRLREEHMEDDIMLDRIAQHAGNPRVGSELALVMGGNREGTLEAFIIKAIPAYNFSLITDSPDMSRIKDWVKADDAKDDTSVIKGKKDKPADTAAWGKALAESGIK